MSSFAAPHPWLGVLLALALGAGTPLAAGDPEPADGSAPQAESSAPAQRSGSRDPKEPVTVRGCLHGSTLGYVEADEDIPQLTPSLRLRGSREMRRQLKAADRHEVEVTGVLTPAPKPPLSGKWGGTTVTVGGADPRRPPGQQAPPPVASIEVTAVRSLSPSCR